MAAVKGFIMERNRKKALLYLVITAVLWSTGGLFIKLVDWNPVAIAGARSGISAVVMLLYLRKPVKPKGKIKLLGACTYASLVIMFVAANKLTTSANAILLQYSAPVWVILFSGMFLKEKIRKHDIAAVFVVMLGMVLFFVGDIKSGNMVGNVLALLSGVSMGAMVILLKLQSTGEPVEITLLGNILTFVVALPFFFLSVPSFKSILGLLMLGIFQLGISYILYTAAIKHVSAVEAILIPILEPLLNPVWVFLFTGESPGTFALIGGAVVIAAIISRELYVQLKLNNTKGLPLEQ
jgi:drug/metabolite transporter (DMT)-like permease